MFDQGKEFLNTQFQAMLITRGIQPVPCSVANPQSNAVLERVHDVMKTAIRTELHTNPPANIDEANAMVDRLLSSCVYAVKCAVHHTFGMSPGASAFQ